jgi:hypothetical protein
MKNNLEEFHDISQPESLTETKKTEQDKPPIPTIPKQKFSIKRVILATFIAITVIMLTLVFYVWFMNKLVVVNKTTDKLLERPVEPPNSYSFNQGDLTNPSTSGATLTISSDLKTYEDENISFKYPANWEILEKLPSEFIRASSNLFDYKDSCRGPILHDPNNDDFILLTDIGTDIELNPIRHAAVCDAGREYSSQFNFTDSHTHETRNVISGKFEEKLTIFNIDKSPIDRITDYHEWFTFSPDYKDQIEFKFGLFYKTSIKDQIRPVFDEILQSFRFKRYYTNAKTPIQWTTFKSKLLNYSFEYPVDWGEAEEKIFDAQESGQGDSGKTYSLSFPQKNLNDFSRVPFASGQSIDFSAGRGGYYMDFRGYKGEGENVFTKLGINVTNCDKINDGWGAYPGNNAYIEFNLPESEINGVRLFVPIFSPYIKNLDHASYCGLSEKSLTSTALTSIDMFTNETEKYHDKETQINLSIYKHILETVKIY